MSVFSNTSMGSIPPGPTRTLRSSRGSRGSCPGARTSRSRGALWVLLALLLTFSAPITRADESDDGEANILRAANRRPVAAVGRNRTGRRSAPQTATSTLPLTRAATQHKLDEVSPLGWLRRFGPVVVDSRDE
jgi:hypothetical protein